MPQSGNEDVAVFHIRDGEIADAGSWVYAWLRIRADRRVIYVGATGLPPGTRAWLHLYDPNQTLAGSLHVIPRLVTSPWMFSPRGCLKACRVKKRRAF